MRTALELCRIFSIAAFLWYGVQLLAFNAMEDDFERYGLSSYRRTIGALEIVGAVGLIAGYLSAPIGVVSAAGLSIIMMAGLVARIQFHDPWLSSIPAWILLIMNIFVGYAAFTTLTTSSS